MIGNTFSQRSALEKYMPPVCKVCLTVFKADTDSVNVEIQYLLGRCLPDGHHPQPSWTFPSQYLRFDQKPLDGVNELLKTHLPGIDAALSTLVGAYCFEEEGIGTNIISFHYIFIYHGGVAQKNSFLDQFSWLSSSQILEISNRSSLLDQCLPSLDEKVRLYLFDDCDELLVEVNAKNEIIGSLSKNLAHRDKTRFHRAVHVLLFNDEGRVYLQLRSTRKERYGGQWSYHSLHVAYGQTPNQSVARAMMEELGISSSLRFFKVYLFESDRESQFTYVYYGIYHGGFGINRNEVDAIKSFDCQTLLDSGYDKRYYIVSCVKAYLEELRFVWEGLKEKGG